MSEGAESLPEPAAPAEPAPAEPVPVAAAPAPQPTPVVATQAQPLDSASNVTQVGALPSPRDAVFLGIGIGGGRLQDDVMGRGGFAFDLNAGYSFTPELSLTINCDGLYYSQPSDTGAEELETQSIVHYGFSAGAQLHLVDVLRFSLSGGYYGLSKDGPYKPVDGADEDIDDESFWSPGGEASVGVEFFQSPGGFAAALEVRSQVSFPDGQLVWDSFALIGARWYGIGAKQHATSQARSSSSSGT